MFQASLLFLTSLAVPRRAPLRKGVFASRLSNTSTSIPSSACEHGAKRDRFDHRGRADSSSGSVLTWMLRNQSGVTRQTVTLNFQYQEVPQFTREPKQPEVTGIEDAEVSRDEDCLANGFRCSCQSDREQFLQSINPCCSDLCEIHQSM